MNVTYHSSHGAIQESMHVFIQAGLRHYNATKPIRIFEMGFGTGLNTLLTLIETEKNDFPIHYTTIELFPLQAQEARDLNYCSLLQREDLQPFFEQLHVSEWEKDIPIGNYLVLHKLNTNLTDLDPLILLKPPEPFNSLIDLVFYDAFAPSAQPELWTTPVFKKLYDLLIPGGMLLTYCSKGDVRRSMQTAGFLVEKIPGPRGKREMVRATKNEK